jgi:methionine-rich copper-binding protein CopC
MVTHRMILAAAVSAAAAITLEPHGVLAHAFLNHASPAVGSSVPTAPAAVTMWFIEQLEPTFTTAMVTDKSGNNVDSGPATVDTQNPTVLRVPLKPLPAGTYTVTWHALSLDTHRTQGHFNFKVVGR